MVNWSWHQITKTTVWSCNWYWTCFRGFLFPFSGLAFKPVSLPLSSFLDEEASSAPLSSFQGTSKKTWKDEDGGRVGKREEGFRYNNFIWEKRGEGFLSEANWLRYKNETIFCGASTYRMYLPQDGRRKEATTNYLQHCLGGNLILPLPTASQQKSCKKKKPYKIFASKKKEDVKVNWCRRKFFLPSLIRTSERHPRGGRSFPAKFSQKRKNAPPRTFPPQNFVSCASIPSSSSSSGGGIGGGSPKGVFLWCFYPPPPLLSSQNPPSLPALLSIGLSTRRMEEGREKRGGNSGASLFEKILEKTFDIFSLIENQFYGNLLLTKADNLKTCVIWNRVLGRTAGHFLCLCPSLLWWW